MEISQKVLEDCAHITVSGMIDTMNAERFISEFDALPEAVKNIVIDLERVEYISSTGLRALLRAAKTAKKRGGEMKVIKAGEFVREILSTVGFDELFKVECHE